MCRASRLFELCRLFPPLPWLAVAFCTHDKWSHTCTLVILKRTPTIDANLDILSGAAHRRCNMRLSAFGNDESRSFLDHVAQDESDERGHTRGNCGVRPLRGHSQRLSLLRRTSRSVRVALSSERRLSRSKRVELSSARSLSTSDRISCSRQSGCSIWESVAAMLCANRQGYVSAQQTAHRTDEQNRL